MSEQIDDLIAKLQKVKDRWGNTTVHYHGDIVWGSVALWEETYEEQPHLRDVTKFSHLAECE